MFLFWTCQWVRYSQTPFEIQLPEENTQYNHNIQNFLLINVLIKFVTSIHLVEVIQLLYKLTFSCAILFTNIYIFDERILQITEGVLI